MIEIPALSLIGLIVSAFCFGVAYGVRRVRREVNKAIADFYMRRGH